MNLALSDFIKAVFRKQLVTFKYKDQEYTLTIYTANINSKVAANYFFQTAKNTASLLFYEDSTLIEQLMKFYLRLQSSVGLKTRVPRIIRRGKRKFDVRTLASRTPGSNFREHITFSQLPYPKKVLDASERYKYLLDKIKLQDGNDPDNQRLFEKAIYIKEVLDAEINEEEYYDYFETILQKLNDWEEKENTFIEEKTDKELDLILEGRDTSSLRILHDRYLEEFINEFSNPLFQRLYFELEGLYYWFWENIFLSVFVKINSQMREVERRAFILMYTRQEYIDYHIPAFEYIIEEFWGSLRTEEQIELVYTLLFVEDSKRDSMVKIYDIKFTDFLKFYPLWVDIIRLDENMSGDEFSAIGYFRYIPKQRPTGTANGKIQKATFESLFESLNNEPDSDTLEASIPVEDEQFKEYDSAHLLHLINTKLSDNEREAIELYYYGEEEDTQVTISKKLDISQSALNQRLKSAILKLKKFY